MLDPDWLADDVFVVGEFFSREECAGHIGQSEGLGYEEAKVTSPRGEMVRSDIRNNQRLILESHELAKGLWKRVEEFLPQVVPGYRAVGLNERFRYYKYEPGQQFDWHQDGPFERGNGEQSFWTMMVYLNADFQGGETAFDDSYSDEPFDAFEVTPEEGMALFFAHQMYHKGEPVVQGRKYVLRTDVMFWPVGRRMRRG